MSNYSELLKDPRWQKKRLEILSRDGWRCRECYAKDKTLHVHHQYYISGNSPWEYDDITLITLCMDCHEQCNRIDWRTAFLDLNITPGQLLDLAIWHRFLLEKYETELRSKGYDKFINRSDEYCSSFLDGITEDELSDYYNKFRRPLIDKYTNG
jgi:hypothetical protein